MSGGGFVRVEVSTEDHEIAGRLLDPRTRCLTHSPGQRLMIVKDGLHSGPLCITKCKVTEENRNRNRTLPDSNRTEHQGLPNRTRTQVLRFDSHQPTTCSDDDDDDDERWLELRIQTYRYSRLAAVLSVISQSLESAVEFADYQTALQCSSLIRRRGRT